jgi:broad specificity phosphatase PhoE
VQIVRTVYLVRHGQTEWNAERRMQGQWDSRLSEAGRRHADESGRFLATRGIQAVYASPLGRVMETAVIIRPHLDIAPVLDDRLMEWSSGDWSGQLYADIAVTQAEIFNAWQADMLNVRSPNGENFHDLMDRAGAFLADLEQSPAHTIAIVAHGFINRALACQLLRYDARETLGIRQANNVIMEIVTGGPGAGVRHFVAGKGPYDGLPLDAGAAVA